MNSRISHQGRSVSRTWVEDKIAEFWPDKNTADMAAYLALAEWQVAGVLADMRDRRDSRLRHVTGKRGWPWR